MTGLLKHDGVVSNDFTRMEAHACPMSICAVPEGSPCRTGKGKVAIQYHTARFRLVPQLAKALNVPTPAVRKPGSVWTELPRPANAGAESVGHVRLGYARASTAPKSQPFGCASLLAPHCDPRYVVRRPLRTELARAGSPERKVLALAWKGSFGPPAAQAQSSDGSTSTCPTSCPLVGRCRGGPNRTQWLASCVLCRARRSQAARDAKASSFHGPV